MTRKDYVAIAGAIAEAYRTCDSYDRPSKRKVLDIVTKELVRVLAADNFRFDRGRFERACSPETCND